MVATASNMLALGTLAPDFQLLDAVSMQKSSLQDLRGEKATMIMFICNHCPYVQHVQTELVKLAKDYQKKGVCCIAINANDVVAYPEDAPSKMAEVAKQFDYPFPYLYDESQAVAKAYQAACTPDFFVFDKNLKCVYRGQLDDSRPGNDLPSDGRDIRQALESLLSNQGIIQQQKPSIGCNIKWKS